MKIREALGKHPELVTAGMVVGAAINSYIEYKNNNQANLLFYISLGITGMAMLITGIVHDLRFIRDRAAAARQKTLH